ncbi:putative phage tail assembly chaperone [uncultured Mediterranean phage uvMED]|nr:putative phage tail assembly chaperone [uncultured Mediterranean phage uvMED]BAR21654.1 putative phage tail assembly chaperone [uncultured Mediterranean phage uvMED]BAR21677.1 putative phage tail assembly chaperone [uncultured Mediterranean phage uvMED]BAR21703.1 putative phage tail assembly chaperone [uncultured Mediterranean phage uvMED]BAR21745.1 putative phage tail assembly chaperone [uncultured Mediterranean phage uvMED]
MEAIELLKNKFGVSQKYKYEVKDGEEIILEIYWHPLTIAERESILAKSKGDDGNEFALNLMIEKALDKNGKRLFQEGHKASLRREVNSTILQEIQVAMMTSGDELKVEEAKAALKS